jgi:ribosomal protein L14E/L6E/L27E
MSRKELIRGYNALKTFCGGNEPSQKEVMDQLRLSAEEAAELISYIHNPPKRGRPPKVIPKIKESTHSDSIHLIRWPMLFVGIGALIGSIYFMIDKLSQTQPMWLASLLGIVLIGFGTMCFEVATYQRRIKAKSWWTFILIWGFVIIYSITATTGSFYNRSVIRKQGQESITVVTSAQKAIYDKYQTQIDGYNNDIKDRRVKLTNFQKTLEKYADPSIERGKEYNNAYWSADTFEKAIRANEAKKNELIAKQTEILNTNPDIVKDTELNKVKDYSEQLAYIFRGLHWEAASIQFVVDTIPSMLLDIISSLSLYVFLFLGKKRLDSKEEK